MTAFLWTYTDLATVYLGYHHGLFDYDEFRRRHAEMKANNYVSGELNNTAHLPHRAGALFNRTAEQEK
jgi:hypothetical protein